MATSNHHGPRPSTGAGTYGLQNSATELKIPLNLLLKDLIMQPTNGDPHIASSWSSLQLQGSTKIKIPEKASLPHSGTSSDAHAVFNRA